VAKRYVPTDGNLMARIYGSATWCVLLKWH